MAELETGSYYPAVAAGYFSCNLPCYNESEKEAAKINITTNNSHGLYVITLSDGLYGHDVTFSRGRATNLSTSSFCDVSFFLRDCEIRPRKARVVKNFSKCTDRYILDNCKYLLILYRNTVRRRFKLYHFSVVHLCIYYGRDPITKGKKDQGRDDTHDNWSITVFFSNFGFKSI